MNNHLFGCAFWVWSSKAVVLRTPPSVPTFGSFRAWLLNPDNFEPSLNRLLTISFELLLVPKNKWRTSTNQGSRWLCVKKTWSLWLRSAPFAMLLPSRESSVASMEGREDAAERFGSTIGWQRLATLQDWSSWLGPLKTAFGCASHVPAGDGPRFCIWPRPIRPARLQAILQPPRRRPKATMAITAPCCDLSCITASLQGQAHPYEERLSSTLSATDAEIKKVSWLPRIVSVGFAGLGYGFFLMSLPHMGAKMVRSQPTLRSFSRFRTYR